MRYLRRAWRANTSAVYPPRPAGCTHGASYTVEQKCEYECLHSLSPVRQAPASHGAGFGPSDPLVQGVSFRASDSESPVQGLSFRASNSELPFRNSKALRLSPFLTQQLPGSLPLSTLRVSLTNFSADLHTVDSPVEILKWRTLSRPLEGHTLPKRQTFCKL